MMTAAASAASPLPLLPQTAVPVRSLRTSIVLAELARQRRLERRQRGSSASGAARPGSG